MIRSRSRAALLVAALAVSSTAGLCPKTPPNLTPHAQAAFKADVIIQRLNTVVDVVIALNHATPPIITDHAEVVILKTIRATIPIVQAAPDGWLAAANAAVDAGLKELTPAEQTQYAPYIALIRDALAAIGSEQEWTDHVRDVSQGARADRRALYSGNLHVDGLVSDL